MSSWGDDERRERARGNQHENRQMEIILSNVDRECLLSDKTMELCLQDPAAANAGYASQVHYHRG